VPYAVTLFLWGVLLVVSGIYMGALDRLEAGVSGWKRLWKGLGVVLLVLGTLELLGSVTGAENPLEPLEEITQTRVAGSGGEGAAEEGLGFQRVADLEEMQAAIDQAAANGRPVMLDFYADWCVECVRYERTTFESAPVQEILSKHDVKLLQVDVTEQSQADKALQRHFGIIGPPAIMFFGADGEEIKRARVAGYLNADKFVGHVGEVFGD
jgi:thiol:disulfide interchange protein DsbD